MIVNPANKSSIVPPAVGKPAGAAASPSATPFAELLRNNIAEASRLQQDAARAVQQVAAGGGADGGDNIAGVLGAVEKSELAFKTLLAIRARLLEAFEEIKNINV